MTRTDVRQWLASAGIVPVIRASSVEKALLAADALSKGGISVLEVTLTVPGAEKAMESLRKTFSDDVLVGAGTVLDVDDAKRCLDAGAQFIVSPGLDTGTIGFANSKDVLVMAGALTPTEVITAWKNGADLVKVFPCSAVGGASYIKSLKGPFPQIPLVPTGGVNLKTAADFIRAGAFALGIGGELVLASALDDGTPQVITALAKEFLEIVQTARRSAVNAAPGEVPK